MATKKEYQEKVEAQLKEWQTGIEKLKVKASEAKGDARVKYQQQLDKLAIEQAAAREKLEEIKQAGEANWEELKAEMERTMSGMQHEFDRFREAAEQQGDDVLSWAKGIAEEN